MIFGVVVSRMRINEFMMRRLNAFVPVTDVAAISIFFSVFTVSGISLPACQLWQNKTQISVLSFDHIEFGCLSLSVCVGFEFSFPFLL